MLLPRLLKGRAVLVAILVDASSVDGVCKQKTRGTRLAELLRYQ
jgi:hypothetical protein